MSFHCDPSAECTSLCTTVVTQLSSALVCSHITVSNVLQVYSFGVTLWQIMERKRPFEGLEPYQVCVVPPHSPVSIKLFASEQDRNAFTFTKCCHSSQSSTGWCITARVVLNTIFRLSRIPIMG